MGQFGDKLNPNSSLAMSERVNFNGADISNDEFLIHVLSEEGAVNQKWRLGKLITKDASTDYNKDKQKDAVYVFSSGQHIIALSHDYEKQGGRTSYDWCWPKKCDDNRADIITDVDCDDLKETITGVNVLMGRGNKMFSLLLEKQFAPSYAGEIPGFAEYEYNDYYSIQDGDAVIDTDLKEGAEYRLNQQYIKDLRDEKQILTGQKDLQARVFDTTGDINSFYKLGKLIGSPIENELTNDDIPEKSFKFSSGKSIILVSNFKQDHDFLNGNYMSHHLQDAKYNLAVHQNNKASWVASYIDQRYPYSDRIFIDIDQEGNPIGGRGLIGLPNPQIQQEAEAAFDQRTAQLKARLDAIRTVGPAGNWGDVDNDTLRERHLGWIKLRDQTGEVVNYAIILEQKDPFGTSGRE